jgi:hypothetical protein
MSVGRTALAGVLGGVGMYIWASIAHMLLPISGAGIEEIPKDESVLLMQLTATLGDASGLYFYPAVGAKPGSSAAERNAAMKNYDTKLAVNPSGLLIYHPAGQKSLTPEQLISEFLVELLESVLAVFLLAQTRFTTFGARVGFVTVAGILASLPTNVSYLIWYGFPATYTTANMLIQVVGFVVAGVVAALVLRSRPAPAAEASI